MALEESKNKTITNRQALLAELNPQVDGCIWVGASSLSKRDKPFSWFNYIFNGSLETTLESGLKSQKSFYATAMFNKRFSMAFIEVEYPKMEDAFKEAIDLMAGKSSSEEKTIILLSQNAKNFTSPLFKKYKNITFKNIIY